MNEWLKFTSIKSEELHMCKLLGPGSRDRAAEELQVVPIDILTRVGGLVVAQ